MKARHVTRVFVFLSYFLGISQGYTAQFIDFKHHHAGPLFNQVLNHSKKTRDMGALYFHTINTHEDTQHIQHARVQQYYQGVPVLGAYAMVHTLQTDNTSAHVEGAMYDNLPGDLGSIPEHFNENAEAALTRFKARFPDGAAKESSVKPVIFIDTLQKAHWAYQLSVLLIQDNEIPERPTAIVDAANDTVLLEWNNIKTLFVKALARGFGGNKNVGKVAYGEGSLAPLEIERHSGLAWCILANPRVSVVDMQHQYVNDENLPISFHCPAKHKHPQSTDLFWTGKYHNGTDASNGAFSPSNDALYAGEVVYKMYKSWINEYVLTDHQQPAPLIMRVHYGYQYENAFWNGEVVTFGDGAKLLYPLVSVGLTAHELSHGFTEQHSDLNFFGEAGGINESFSDMAAQAAEAFSSGNASFTIGTEVLKDKVRFGALRYMEQPSLDGHSIDDASQYRPRMNPHYSSGVYNRLFFILAHQPGWDVKKAFQLMAKANMDYWVPNTTFQSGACGIRSAARDLNDPIEDVNIALSSVGLHPEQCDAPAENTPPLL